MSSAKPHCAFLPQCRHLSSWFVALFTQKQVVESDDNVGKVRELHKVWSDDVDPVCPWPLGFNPGHDGWEVPRVTGQEKVRETHTHTVSPTPWYSPVHLSHQQNKTRKPECLLSGDKQWHFLGSAKLGHLLSASLTWTQCVVSFEIKVGIFTLLSQTQQSQVAS